MAQDARCGGKCSPGEITARPESKNPRYLIVHQVICPGSSPAHSRHEATALYLDVPRLFQGDNAASPLRGRLPGYQAQQQAKGDGDISFVIFRSYSCVEYHSMLLESRQRIPVGRSASSRSLHPAILMQPHDGAPASSFREYMEINSKHLKDAMEAMRALGGQFERLVPGWDREQNMLAPYLHFYHLRRLLRSSPLEALSDTHQQHLGLVLEYLESHFGREYDEADDLFVQGYVTKNHFHKLFGPGEILVTFDGEYPVAVVAKHPPLPGSDPIRVECETWSFDGRFTKHAKTVVISWPSSETGMERIPIRSLASFPLRFDQTGLQHELRKRGETFWTCRKREFVSYTVPEESLRSRIENGRYMIDSQTYRHFHKAGTQGSFITNYQQECLAGETFEKSTPPPGSFVLMLPPTIYGYAFHDKIWRELAVKHIAPINWNREKFNQLVLPAESKEFLAALVTKHRASFEEGASNETGVAILLYGAFGTGKTFAAEAVAEFARRPLYRLNASDIGTDPVKMGRNIDDALHLSSIWQAVVLLDNCDVFLAARSGTGFEHNSIVSVMLQALDKWKGVLILTSSRFGVIDLAFRSRIRLAIKFAADEKIREQIWEESLNQSRVDETTKAVFRKMLGSIERYNFNGREMRNVIETAKLLALHRAEPVSLHHINEAIETIEDVVGYISK